MGKEVAENETDVDEDEMDRDKEKTHPRSNTPKPKLLQTDKSINLSDGDGDDKDDEDDEDDGNDNRKDNEDDEDDDNGNDNEDDIPYTSKRRILKKDSKEVSKIKQLLKNFLEGDDSESSQSRLRPKRGRDDQDDYMKEKKRLRTGAESNEKGMELDDS